MSDVLAIVEGKYTGRKYLITADAIGDQYVLRVYRPGQWSLSLAGGAVYRPGHGEKFRGRWLRHQERRARTWVRGLERVWRRSDRRDDRIARLAERRRA